MGINSETDTHHCGTSEVGSVRIVETAGAIYEVDENENCFRLIHAFDTDSAQVPVGQWHSFQRMSPVQIDAPVSFFWLIAGAGRSARVGFLQTAPVVRFHQVTSSPRTPVNVAVLALAR